MSTLGAKIREFRRERGITLTDLAIKLEVSPSFLSAVERDVKKPSLIMLKKISSHLNISLSYLLTSPGESKGLGEKLRSIREERGLSIEDLAELSTIPVEHIDNIERYHVTPSPTQLEKLADSLNVSIRFFSHSMDSESNPGTKIKNLREGRSLSQAQLAELANVSPGLISQIENGVTAPSLETLEKLANCLKVNPSFFLYNEDKGALSSDLSPELISLLDDPKVQSILYAVRDLDPNELNFVLQFLDFFKNKRKLLS